MSIDIPANVQRDRAAIENAAAAATIRLEELKRAYADSPEMRFQRDQQYLQRLRNERHHLNRTLTANAARNESASPRCCTIPLHDAPALQDVRGY
jgi:hypothetical protein